MRVASNQVQYSVIDRRPELFLSELCAKHSVSLLPYGVLVRARLYFTSDLNANACARLCRDLKPQTFITCVECSVFVWSAGEWHTYKFRTASCVGS